MGGWIGPFVPRNLQQISHVFVPRELPCPSTVRSHYDLPMSSMVYLTCKTFKK